jgi:hypothetical protein
MILNEYDNIIREHFDISDFKTRKTLASLDEAEQNQMLSVLTNALYDKIVNKVDDIDFGSIPMSRGDITKVQGFDNTLECLNIMRKIVLQYNQDPAIVDTVLTAIENIKTRKNIFIKAYALNIELPMVIYNLIVMSIEQATSLMISVCIQYIKDPNTKTVTAALDKVAYNNTMNNMLYEQLYKFNTACKTKELDKTLDLVIKNGGRVTECGELPSTAGNTEDNDDVVRGDESIENGVAKAIADCDDVNSEERPDFDYNEDKLATESIGAIAAEIGIKGLAGIAAGVLSIPALVIKVVIPFLRSITYYLYHTKAKLSDTLDVQSQFLQANAYKLQNSMSDPLNPVEDRKQLEKTITKQLKFADKLKSWSNKLAIKDKKAEKAAKNMEKEDSRKMKMSDFGDNLPADIGLKYALF